MLFSRHRIASSFVSQPVSPNRVESVEAVILESISNMPIIFDCCGRVEEAKKNVHPKIGKGICAANVEKVWCKVSEFIENQLCAGRGVRIPGFVTFNYKVFTRDVNQKKVVVERVPFMLLNEELVKMYDLKARRPPFNFDVPEIPLNLSQITCETGMPRACVEASVDEVVQAFKRALVTDNHVEFHFPDIGRLVIKCGEVNPFFCTQFMIKNVFGQEILKDKACPKLP